ncbi:MAG: hypothetical protein NC131_21925 [Roseburia sp.]|nr:hypothetical protein [Roseburia sp.]
MKDTKVQWHPGFVAAMNLEFAENRNDLEFIREYNLNRKPLEIDLLVIKKEKDASIDNEIGAIFRGHNIVEYKSPKDHLNIDTFYKTQAYACLYKAYGKTVDSVKADDVTVSLVRDSRPEGLFRYFEGHRYSVRNPYSGVYYIQDVVMFPTQIIVTKELETDAHVWLKALSDRVGKQDMAKLLERISRLTEQGDRELADSVLEVSLQVNRKAIEEMEGDDSVSDAVLEILQPLVEPIIEARMEPIIEARMEPIIEARMKPIIETRMEPIIEARVEARIKRENIQGMIEILRDLGHEDTEIRQIIEKKYGLSDEETAEYV